MRILVYGAGVVGTIFAEKLFRAGNEVTILARGQRLAELLEHGVIAVNSLTGESSYCSIKLTGELCARDHYDLILVAVRKTQVRGVLPALVENTESPNILLMANTAEDYSAWCGALGQRLLVGFPGFGGTRTAARIRYAFGPAWLQTTMIGELDGRISARLKRIASVFQAANIPTTYCRKMHAWQTTHAVMASALGDAIFAAGSAHLVPLRTDLLDLIINAVREGFGVLDALSIPITPSRLKAWQWLPKVILRRVLRTLYQTKMFAAVTGHLWAARDEMSQLSAELRVLAKKANHDTPAIHKLAGYIDQASGISVAA